MWLCKIQNLSLQKIKANTEVYWFGLNANLAQNNPPAHQGGSSEIKAT